MKTLPGILIAIVLLIVYGSLYPWHFVARQLASTPLDILIHSWHIAFDRRFIADIVINIALYIPLGMAAYLTFRQRRSKPVSATIAMILGTLISAFIEMTQIFIPSRDCSALDLLDNIIGSAVGVLAGTLFERLARPIRFRIPDRSALALLYCWIASLLFPLVPALRLSALSLKLSASTAAPSLDAVPFLSACASWLAAGYLFEAVGVATPRMWAAGSVLLLPMQFVIMDRQPRLSDLLGALAGVSLFCFTKRSRPFAAWFFFATLLFRGLYPLNFTAPASHLSWIPFAGFLGTGWQSGMLLLIVKAFFYGTAIWLMRAAALPHFHATLIVVVTLALIEYLQQWLPGRTAEITDPVLAILIGLGLHILAPSGRATAMHTN